jgi:hypothetical protein
VLEHSLVVRNLFPRLKQKKMLIRHIGAPMSSTCRLSVVAARTEQNWRGDSHNMLGVSEDCSQTINKKAFAKTESRNISNKLQNRMAGESLR